MNAPQAAQAPPVVHSDPDILSGMPLFVGTRVPFRALIDYLEGGHTLAEFLDDFPTVKREQALAALEQAADNGLEARRQERKRFLDLADRLGRSHDLDEQGRLKAELARLTFGE